MKKFLINTPLKISWKANIGTLTKSDLSLSLENPIVVIPIDDFEIDGDKVVFNFGVEDQKYGGKYDAVLRDSSGNFVDIAAALDLIPNRANNTFGQNGIISVEPDYGGGGGGGDTPDIFFSGTAAEVKALRAQNKLVPGAFYRITDYVATTTQEGTQSANHPFDIIVKAIAPDTLSEKALAAPHAGDTYFTGLGAKLEAWRLMYCIDDDADRFIWADTENGKGVVYRMIDEWGNDAPYDFKGILILRDAAFWAGNDAATALAEKTFGTQTPGDKYLYLFTAVDSNGNILDASSTRISAVIEEEPAGLITCAENVFAGFVWGHTDDGECVYSIAKNVFLAKISDADWEHVFSVTNSTFYGTVSDNTSYGYMENNTFSGYVNENIFAEYVGNNAFSGNIESNIFDGYVGNNVFSGSVHNNIFSGEVSNNIFSGQVGSNTFSGQVLQNTFSGDVLHSTFPANISYNTFDGSIASLILQGSGTKYMSNCRIYANLPSGLTLVSTGQEPPGLVRPAEFNLLTITGDCYNQAQGQTVQVQKYSRYEQVIAADADGIFHVFTPWITP